VCEKDRQLLEQLLVDPERIADIIEEHGAKLLGRLHAYANNRGYGNANVEDVFQDAMVKLLDPEERAAIFAAGGCILPYLTRWGYWRLDTLWRKRDAPLDEQDLEAQPSRQGGPGERGAELEQEQDQESAEDEIGADVQAALERAWQRLSPRDQLLLTLRYFESYSEAELAAYLKSTPGAIKKALADARRRLRDLLTIEGFDVEE
jgi:RNA polymerase sigma factor (sigma-70 family)